MKPAPYFTADGGTGASPPARGRGLKQDYRYDHPDEPEGRPPHGGAD